MRFLALTTCLWFLTSGICQAAESDTDRCASQLFDGLVVSLADVDQSGQYAIYLTSIADSDFKYGQLVALMNCEILFTAGRPSSGSMEGPQPAQPVLSAQFVKTRYGNTLADFRRNVGITADLCGHERTGDYLSFAPIALPRKIPDSYNSSGWSVFSVDSRAVTFQLDSRPSVTRTLEFDEPVSKAYSVSALLLSDGASITGAFAIKLRSGKLRYFGNFGSYREYYVQPDNRFSERENDFCSL